MRLTFDCECKHKSKTGFISTVRKYSCKFCNNCTLKDKCTNSEKGRSIQINENLNKLQEKTLKLLESDKGTMLRLNRSIQSEGTFGQMKQNDSFTRFVLKGFEKVNIEINLYSFAYNIRKYASKKYNSRLGIILHSLA